jgi:hypothetical protein
MIDAFLVAKLFGIISQKSKIKKVTIHVAIPIAYELGSPEESATDIAKLVARAAVYTFARLFQISIAIRSLSLFSLICLRHFAQNFPCFIRDSILWSAKLIRAISVPEKNADNKKSIINKSTSRGSIIK